MSVLLEKKKKGGDSNGKSETNILVQKSTF